MAARRRGKGIEKAEKTGIEEALLRKTLFPHKKTLYEVQFSYIIRVAGKILAVKLKEVYDHE